MDRRTASSATSSRRRLAIGGLLIAVAALGYGCFERSLKPVNPCTTSVQSQIIQVTSVDKVDLLLMIDNSNSMTEEQQSVVQEIPRIITILTSGHDATGVIPDFMPARSLHVGIVDCDMGLGNTSGIATCDTGFGDDGLMQMTARRMPTGCMASYAAQYAATPNVFDFTVGGTTTATQFGMDVGCVANLGTDGCGFEHELEAPLKALSLTPNADGSSPVTWTHAGYQPPGFWPDATATFGHGSDPSTNGAFLRPDSALAIVTVNDEDDCSTPDKEIFALTDPYNPGTDLNLRCHVHADHLYPVSRYADGFLGLRSNPALLIYGAITGVPPADAGLDPAVILMDPAMVETVDPAHPTTQLLPSCISPGGRGVAYPAIRMTQLAQQLDAAGAASTVQSICNTDFSSAFSEIIRIVSQALSGACLARALNPDADGNVSCDVLEALPIIGTGAEHEHCDQLDMPDAYTLDHIETITSASGDTQMREVCRVHQVGRAGAGTVPGWAYDDGNSALMTGWSALPMGCTQRIGFSVISPENGAEVRLQCDETILPSSHVAAQLGTACTPGDTTTVDCTMGTAVAGNPMHLACDTFDRSCQIACTNDSDCTGAGLLSYVCDHRTAADYFSIRPDSIPPTDVHNFCVNPTCGQAVTQ